MKRTPADDLFWISGIASIATDIYAIVTLDEGAFYAAACLMCVAVAACLWGDE